MENTIEDNMQNLIQERDALLQQIQSNIDAVEYTNKVIYELVSSVNAKIQHLEVVSIQEQ